MRTITKRTAAATVAALVLAGCGGAAEGGGGPLASGIGVEGAWTVEVRNADGTLDERVEFHNDLTFSGEAALSRVLTGESSIAGLWLRLDGQVASPGVGEGLCNDIDGTIGPCFVVPTRQTSATGAVGPDLFDNAVMTRTGTVATISGTAVAAFDAAVTSVATGLSVCPSSTAPRDCLNFFRGNPPFTATTLPSPVDVAAGQSIQVEVQLSFGTLGG